MKPMTCLLGALLAGSALVANASEYGCTVLLCLANPNGPRAVADCVPPVNKLFHDLARGRAFPTCDLASAPGAAGGISWAQRGSSYYDICPAGTTALDAGSYAIQGGATPLSWGSATLYTGIGEGDGLSPGSGSGAVALSSKVCVGRKVTDIWITTGSGQDMDSVPATVFDRVVLLDPQGSPNIIDVYVNAVLYSRVRW